MDQLVIYTKYFDKLYIFKMYNSLTHLILIIYLIKSIRKKNSHHFMDYMKEDKSTLLRTPSANFPIREYIDVLLLPSLAFISPLPLTW